MVTIMGRRDMLTCRDPCLWLNNYIPRTNRDEKTTTLNLPDLYKHKPLGLVSRGLTCVITIVVVLIHFPDLSGLQAQSTLNEKEA